MKYYETHFEEYIQSIDKVNLHPKLNKLVEMLPNNIENLCNLILYGPPGIGKYSQALNIIKKYSTSNLKYEKKISITFNKEQYYFKISDIHYEIDMALLGCNSKSLWYEIFIQIVDIINTSTNHTGIILCKNFNEIHNELLDNFYSYIQKNNENIIIKFILITEEISFIPNNILSCCEIINIPRPIKKLYNNCIKLKNINNKLFYDTSLINNIKSLYNSKIEQIKEPHKNICNNIIHQMINVDELKFIKFRDLIYEIFIYNLDVSKCVWHIITELLRLKQIKTQENISLIFIKTYKFFILYNNNYRPIYHVENYLFYIISIIHGF
jgi:hypothetical protein